MEHIEKSKILEIIKASGYQPVYIHDLANILDVPAEKLGTFEHIINEIIAEGYAVRTKRGKLATPAQVGLAFGVYEANLRGFGFVLADSGDIFIPPGHANSALHGDAVLCKIKSKNGTGGPSKSGEIVEIIKPTTKHIVGTFIKNRSSAFIVPNDKRFPEILIKEASQNGAKHGQTVVAAIKNRKSGLPFEGKITNILGNPHDIGLDVLTIVADHDIPYVFPKAVLQAADTVPQVVLPDEIIGRRDFRGLPTVTIDGADTKDIDDAVSLETTTSGGFRLYVHIADVAHYVQPGTVLWKEAAKRATSVYLADRVIPMLPKQLSNGICSLNPGVDRLALSCVMEFDASARVVSHEICESVIHSQHSITYEDLAEILEGKENDKAVIYQKYLPIFQNMRALAKSLKQRRIEQGALEFDFAECKIEVDEKGRVTAIKRRERNIAHSIIEEFMIAVNETVSAQYHWLDVPFIYRTHEEPDRAKIEVLMNFLRNFGHSMRGGKTAKALQNLLERIEGKPEALIISKQVLRSLKQARYSSTPTGHFGLAKEFYSHFTSPIRRFPDLFIHAVIKAHMAGEMDGEISREISKLVDVCKNSSENERRADACAGDVEKLKKLQFMKNKIGQRFDGIISFTATRGFYVELENTVEGMVSVESLRDDYYVFRDDISALIGRRTGKTYTIGDSVCIVVTGVDTELGRLDFELSGKRQTRRKYERWQS